MRKCKGVGEVAVMEVAQVGVRTRARSMAMAMAAENSRGEKRRKVRASAELSISSSLAQLRAAAPENSVSQAASSDQCNVSCGSVHATSSCCSSNGSTEVPKDRTLKLVDLEGDRLEIETSRCNLDRRERRETTPSSEFQVESGELESTAKAPPSAANSPRNSVVEKMPPAAELEEFFAAAEKKMAKEFAEKYNYDIEKDIPLEGRYEWVKLKP